jgi:DNA-binding MarR family transcriptional regulator
MSTNIEKPNYFIMFPTYLLEELTHSECILCGLLTSLAKSTGYAYPSNNMLAETLSVSYETIQRYLTKLESKGYIRRQMSTDYGRRIYLTSKLIGGNLNNAMGTHVKNDTPPPQIQGMNSITNISKSNRYNYTNEFDHVWDLYGKVGNKLTAFRSWERLTKIEQREIVEHIPRYITNHKNHQKMDFVPHLTTYLNGRRWEDELPYKVTAENDNQVVEWD